MPVTRTCVHTSGAGWWTWSVPVCLDALHEGREVFFAARVGGAIAQSVYQFITSELGLHISDSGGGCESWHLGTPCNQEEMERLTAALHERFARAVAIGLLRVQVKFWGWKFRT